MRRAAAMRPPLSTKDRRRCPPTDTRPHRAEGVRATTRTRQPRRQAHTTPLTRARRRTFWIFVTPAALLYAALMLVPTLQTIWISFNEWRGTGPMEYVGLRNYASLISDPSFIYSFKNTLIIQIVVGGITFL